MRWKRAFETILLVVLAIELAVAMSSCRPDRKEPTPDIEWPTLPLEETYDADNFSIDYPAMWRACPGGEDWPTVNFVNAEQVSPGGFGVSWFDDDRRRPLKEDVYARIYARLKTSGAKVIYEGPTVIAGMEGYEVIIIEPGGVVASLFGDRYKRWYAVIRDEETGEGFSVSGGAPEDDWDKAWPIFEAMRDSFRVK